MKHKIWIVAIAIGVLALVARFFHLSTIPASLYHDEMDHVFTGQSLATWGTDITGTWTPWLLQPLHTLNYTAELTSIFYTFSKNPHLPNTIAGLMSATLTGYLTLLLFNKKGLAALTTAIILSNPWHIHISRTSFEAPISLVFQLCFIVTWIKLSSTKSLGRQVAYAFLSTASLFLGFYTYHGAKITLPVLTGTITLLTSYRIKLRRMWALSAIIMLIASALLFRTKAQIDHGFFGPRESELITNAEYLGEQVNHIRSLSLDSPWTPYVWNKATVFASTAFKNYLEVFRTDKLFTNGYADGFQLSPLIMSFYYRTDLLLMGLGLWWLIKYRHKHNIFWVLLLVSPIANVLTISSQSTYRSALTYTLLCIPISIGILHLLKLKKPLITYTVAAILIIRLISYSHTYLTHYPILAADNHYLDEKLLAGYLQHINEPLTIVTEKYPYSATRGIIYYQGLLNSLTDLERDQFSDTMHDTYTIGYFTITNQCPTATPSAIIADAGRTADCDTLHDLPTPDKQISSPVDGHAYWLLHTDTVCQKVDSPPHLDMVSNDLDIMKLSVQEFCENWTTKRPQN